MIELGFGFSPHTQSTELYIAHTPSLFLKLEGGTSLRTNVVSVASRQSLEFYNSKNPKILGFKILFKVQTYKRVSSFDIGEFSVSFQTSKLL